MKPDINQLKAEAYDLIAQLEQKQAEMNSIREQLQIRNTQIAAIQTEAVELELPKTAG